MPLGEVSRNSEAGASMSVILDAVSDAILTLDHRAEIQYANQGVSRLLGYDPSELTGKSVKLLLPEDAAARHDGHLDDFRDRGYVDLTGVPRDLVIRARDGGERHIELILDPLPSSGPPLFVAILRDLSMRDESRELIRQRSLLAENEKRFRDFAECGADWFWEIDADLRFTYMSPQVETATGFSPEWHLGKTRIELGLDEENDELMAELYQTTSELDDFHDRIQVRRHRNGGHVWINFSGIPLYDEAGDFIGYRGVSRDVTERVQRENALRATNAELENFAYAASHDLQEPLRKIMAFGERLNDEMDGQLDDLPAMYLSRMMAASGRMSVLINDLLEFSRAGRPPDESVPVDMNAVVEQVLADQELAVHRTGATFEIERLPVVLGHESQLYQLMGNLIGNAMKFTQEGRPPFVRVSVRRSEAWCVIEVADNGIGFDDVHASRIFELFGRLHGRSEFEGTGLGLAICRKVVEFMKGRLEAHGTPGEGAVFTICFPWEIIKDGEVRDERAA